MLSTKYSKDKRARLSESKQGNRRDSTTKKSITGNNRSSSVYRSNKPERLMTDYSDYDNSQTANIGNYARFQHKFSKRRDTYECGI